MCGRSVLTLAALQMACEMIKKTSSTEVINDINEDIHDNLNLSPGMQSVVFHKIGEGSTIGHSTKIWGLISRGGTVSQPLPEGANKHFENLMFNARSDTLYEKRTFLDLARRGQTCLWAMDGFYEWKKDPTSATKQPYYVYRKSKTPLLVPGLWTKVPTGRIVHGEPEILETFTHITTDACKPLRWLHHRQPCFVWDLKLAVQWLLNPSEALLREISQAATEMNDENNQLAWHAVTKQMSNVSYRGDDCNHAIKIPKIATLSSFFSKQIAQESSGTNSQSLSKLFSHKEDLKQNKISSPQKETVHKKGSITKYFSPQKVKKEK